jgi:hypothetical protein
MEAPRPPAIDPPPTCADATQNTIPSPTKIGSKKVADVKGVKKIKKGLRKEEAEGKIAAPPGALHH